MKKLVSMVMALCIAMLLPLSQILAFNDDQPNGVMPEMAPLDRSFPDITYDRHKLGISPYGQQGTSYGAPAACQVILAKHGIYMTQKQIAQELGTTNNGTAVGGIPAFLNRKIGWSQYPKSGEAGYRLGKISSHGDEDENVLWNHILQSVKYGDPIIFLIDTSYFDSNNPGMKYVVSNGYRIGNLPYPGGKDSGTWRDIVYFDTDPKEYDATFGYEKAEFMRTFMDAMVSAGGYYIW